MINILLNKRQIYLAFYGTEQELVYFKKNNSFLKRIKSKSNLKVKKRDKVIKNYLPMDSNLK